MGRLIEGVWDCPYCGSERIRGSIRECPTCGRQRDQDISFYIADPKNYVDQKTAETISRNPDWLCSYCDGLNDDNVNECHHCGASREGSEKNYFEHKDEVEARRGNKNGRPRRYTDSDFLYIDGKFLLKTPETQAKYDAINRAPLYEQEAKKEATDRYSNHAYDSFGGNSVNTRKQDHDDRMPHITKETDEEKLVKSLFQRDTNKKRFSLKNIFKFGAGLLAALLLIACVAWLFTPKIQDVTVHDFSWERNINVQKLVTLEQSGWSLPPGARLQSHQQEIQGYEQVLDHYETKTEEYYESELTGYETHVSYIDLGNGYFEEVETKTPVYEQVKKTREIQVPIYRDEPIYATKYYYEIDEWQHDYTSTSSGNDKSPYWNEITITNSKQREGNRTETYYVSVVNQDGEIKKYSFDFNTWNELESGQTVTIKTTVFGTAELVKDD